MSASNNQASYSSGDHSESLSPSQKRQAVEIARSEGITCPDCGTGDLLVVGSSLRAWEEKTHHVYYQCKTHRTSFVKLLSLMEQDGELVLAPVEKPE